MSDVGFTSQKGELHRSSIARRPQSRTADRYRDTFLLLSPALPGINPREIASPKTDHPRKPALGG